MRQEVMSATIGAMTIAIGIVLSRRKGVFYVTEEDRGRYAELHSRSARLYRTGALCFVGDSSDGQEVVELAHSNLGLARHGAGYQLHQPHPRERDPEASDSPHPLHRAGIVEVVKDAYEATRERKFRDHVLRRYGLDWETYRNPKARRAQPELFKEIDSLFSDNDLFNVRLLLMGLNGSSRVLEMWDVAFPGVANKVAGNHIAIASSQQRGDVEYSTLFGLVLSDEMFKPHKALHTEYGQDVVKRTLKRVLTDTRGSPASKTEAKLLDAKNKRLENWEFLL